MPYNFLNLFRGRNFIQIVIDQENFLRFTICDKGNTINCCKGIFYFRIMEFSRTSSLIFGGVCPYMFVELLLQHMKINNKVLNKFSFISKAYLVCGPKLCNKKEKSKNNSDFFTNLNQNQIPGNFV